MTDNLSLIHYGKQHATYSLEQTFILTRLDRLKRRRRFGCDNPLLYPLVSIHISDGEKEGVVVPKCSTQLLSTPNIFTN